MKNITITLNVDGNEVVRKYDYDTVTASNDFSGIIEDMLDTLEKSSEEKF